MTGLEVNSCAKLRTLAGEVADGVNACEREIRERDG